MTDFDRFDRPLARAARPHGGAQTAACLDAGTLAAWTDGSLRPAERAAAEAHAADCGRCLALLAAMARTEPPPSVTSRASWLSVRWLVPLTTAAVVVTVWTLVRHPGMDPASVPVPSVSAPAAPAAVDTKPDDLEARRDGDQRQEVSETQAQKKDAEKEAGKTPAALADNASSKRAVDALARQRAEAQGAAAAAAPLAPAPPPPPAVPAPQPFKAEAPREDVTRLQERRAMTAGVIASPDPAIQWRISGRAIERTVDGGRTWNTQATATAELHAGAAPAPTTCWIVGRAGLVMLSRDGRTWQMLTAPAPGVELVSVTAVDALSAAVTTADKRTYRTIDGGRSWTLQENPAASF